MYHIYTSLLYLILPWLLLRLWWQGRRNPAYLERIPERFGWYTGPKLSATIWVHAVSVGEALAAIPLIKALLPAKVVVTTMTPTGAECLQKAFPTQVVSMYVPYDYPWIIKRFLAHICPKILIIMETELWPNMLYYTNRAAIPIILANARLSKKSFIRYKKIPQFAKILECIDCIAAQSTLDATRFALLGATNVKVFGNVKFDSAITAATFQAGKALRHRLPQRFIWVAGSTHPGEEAQILAAASNINAVIPEVLLILVPRHVERCKAVYTLCHNQGFRPAYYTGVPDPTCNVLIGDVMGKLLEFYVAADVAFVGGSLVPFGGHNLLEPAAVHKPVLTGPHLTSFTEIGDFLLRAQGLLVVANAEELATQVIALLQDPRLCATYSANAYRVVMQHRGATAKILDQVKLYL